MICPAGRLALGDDECEMHFERQDAALILFGIGARPVLGVCKSLIWLVGPPGFEPGTSCTPSGRVDRYSGLLNDTKHRGIKGLGLDRG